MSVWATDAVSRRLWGLILAAGKRLSFKTLRMSVLVAQTYNPATLETETRRLQVQSQPRQVKNDNKIKTLPLKRIKMAPRTYALFLVELMAAQLPVSRAMLR